MNAPDEDGTGADGAKPNCDLVMDPAGNLYSMTTAMGFVETYPEVFLSETPTMFELSPPQVPSGSWMKTTLHSFGRSDVSSWIKGSVEIYRDGNGDIYAGMPQSGAFGAGAVFQFAPPGSPGSPWQKRTVHSFSPASGPYYDSAQSVSAMIADSDGNLYGTAAVGGRHGLGMVYELVRPTTPEGSWLKKTLYSFRRSPEGAVPLSPLVADPAGNLYGTTTLGGINDYGTVFRLSPPASSAGNWTETVLYSFGSSNDGASPESALIIDVKGNLYGTTDTSFQDQAEPPSGIVFELSPPVPGQTDWTETVLDQFVGQAGYAPRGRLVLDGSGNLYGTTTVGGAGAGGFGAVFELSPPPAGETAWIETELYAFTGGFDGGTPSGGLLLDASGNLYGTTSYGGFVEAGGMRGDGTIFELQP